MRVLKEFIIFFIKNYKRLKNNILFKKNGVNLRNATVHKQNYNNLIIGSNVYLGDVFLDTHDKITIENNVGLGHGVKILTGSHNPKKNGQERAKVISKPVIIRTGAWVASFVIILPGTIIGEHAVVSAGSVVRGKVPPYAIVAGNPANVVSMLK